ncbi:18S rRNA (guanine1575-N7)-methyltransferase [Neophaeococcomyces mojaviensis]|uniref:18S rRNA (Guanine1575-N7)-methyltransferase n=1 Tax=Neophaeococcomyces mojaviensis TaxID=3383035 RepID=A0ACC2ZTT1_9EURO|nr:18S rRNA (guanine1575-N7)-methyltransferase [Knufia sp. JES_112]
MSRPEDTLPPDLYYNDTTSRQYTRNTRIRQIQADMTDRALELLDLQQPSFILDLGCGSGLSGEILDKAGHTWVGMDISPSMLDVALQRQQQRFEAEDETEDVDVDEDNDNEDDDEDDEDVAMNGHTNGSNAPSGGGGDLFLADMGQGLPFRPGTFDAAISISAIQWLCNVDSTDISNTAEMRLRRFFDTLYSGLKRNSRAVCQFYPKNDVQKSMITKAAIRAGFGAGLLEDDEGTKNAKTYLVLSVGGGDISSAVAGMEGVDVEDGRQIREAMKSGKHKRGKSGGMVVEGSKKWIMEKKEKMRGKGKVVKGDSKYTGRKRRVAF